MDDPDMGHWEYGYDVVGNLISQTDAKGQTIEFTYDPLSRITQKRNNAITQVTYIYDRYDDGSTQNVIGRLAKVEDRSGNTVFYYDRLGRERKTVKTVDDTSYTVNRSYDTLDRLISVTYPDGELVSYAYNSAGGVEKVVGSKTYVKNIDYSASGQMTHIEYGNGTSTDYEYDPKTLRLSKLSTLNSQGVKLQGLSYQFDNVGNVTSIIDQVNTATQSFGYDDLNRLISAQGSYGSLSFGYDSIGNVLQKGDITFTYGENGAGPHAVTSASGGLDLQMTYDTNGNMVQKGDQVFEYDPENRLIKVDEAGQVTAFIYDGDGGRVKKITPDGETLYIGSLYEIKSTDDSPQSTVKSIFLGSNRICQVEGDEVYYYHQDHIGSSNVITDKDGNQVALYEYKPYGENSKIDGSFSTDIRFTGKRLDTSTGLYYYGARYYDPEVGRFITADPTIVRPFDPQDLNRYSYCRNNPIRYIDATGLGWFSKFWKKVKNFFSDVWDFAKDKLLGPAIAFVAAVTVTVLTGGTGAAVWIGGSSAAGAAATLDTGEGRQLIRRVAHEFFDDVIGMSSRAAHFMACLTLHTGLTWGYSRVLSGLLPKPTPGGEVGQESGNPGQGNRTPGGVEQRLSQLGVESPFIPEAIEKSFQQRLSEALNVNSNANRIVVAQNFNPKQPHTYPLPSDIVGGKVGLIADLAGGTIAAAGAVGGVIVGTGAWITGNYPLAYWSYIFAGSSGIYSIKCFHSGLSEVGYGPSER